MRKTILLTGGAGYIGSHIAWLLAKHDYNVIIIDNLQYNQTYYAPWATVIHDDFAHKDRLHNIFSQHHIDAVVHCAAFIEVSNSLKDPRSYYDNNLFKTGILIEAMLNYGIKQFVFSSTCAVYGKPTQIPITEEQPCNPYTPYGKTKLMVEHMLADYAQAYDLKFVSLRYFNAAGAEPEHNLGEQHQPETHVIPLLLHAMHYKKPFMLFGTDYDTPDGTCIRDFLHVTDIAHAHYLALRHLEDNQPSDYFNLGTGQGTSLKQLIHLTQKLFNVPIKVTIADRRPGDPARLVADPTKVEHILKWNPKQSHLEHVLTSAHTYMLKYLKQQEIINNLRHPI